MPERKRSKNTDPNLLSDKERVLSPEDSYLVYQFVNLCLQGDISFQLNFDTARTVSGEKLFDKSGTIKDRDTFTHDDFDQGPQGFRIEVANSSYRGEDGHEKIYRSIGQGITDALQIVYGEMMDKHGEDFAKNAFKKNGFNLT